MARYTSKGIFFMKVITKININIMKKIDIRLINDDLIVYAVNVLLFTYEEVCEFTVNDWMKVLSKYEM